MIFIFSFRGIIILYPKFWFLFYFLILILSLYFFGFNIIISRILLLISLFLKLNESAAEYYYNTSSVELWLLVKQKSTIIRQSLFHGSTNGSNQGPIPGHFTIKKSTYWLIGGGCGVALGSAITAGFSYKANKEHLAIIEIEGQKTRVL